MADEAIEFLRPQKGNIILDATVGCAGHAEKILEKISPGGFLIGIDADQESLAIAGERLKRFKRESYSLSHGNFRDTEKIFKKLDIKKIDGALFDLGISSFQLEKPDRGFSFGRDGSLDMRMDSRNPVRAYDLVNRCKREDLEEIIKTFGEERFSRRIAGAILEERKTRPIKTTRELADLITRSVGGRYRMQKIHPATRTFQALRIAVNDELKSLEEVITKIWDFLNPGARACFISFHSLEDRIVKRGFKELAKLERALILTKKPITPSEEEKAKNARARSAKMRVAEKK